MFKETEKSIKALLYERVASPLFGTFICSWLIFNWKIVYLTLFVSEDEIKETKIEYIIKNYSDQWPLYWYPLISTATFILIVPFIANGAYWVHLQFNQWKLNKKNEVEKNQLLTVEQSVAIRMELRESEVEFEKVVSKKESEITLLKKQITALEAKIQDIEKQKVEQRPSKIVPKLVPNPDTLGPTNLAPKNYNEFKQNATVFKYFPEIIESINMNQSFPPRTPERIKEFFLVNDIIRKRITGDHEFTPLGKTFYKAYFNENFGGAQYKE
jgi:hypothetical protein